MRIPSIVLLTLSIASGAIPTIYQEQNFSIEFPAAWQKAETPPDALALVRSPDGAKGVIIIAYKIAPEKISTALKEFIAGAKNGAIEKGIAIKDERDLKINEVPFHTYSFALPNSVTIVSNITVAGNWGYSVQGFSSVSDPAADPEVSGVLQSFRLLSPPAAISAVRNDSEPGGEAYRVGQMAGTVAFIAFVAGVIVLLGRTLTRGKKESS